MHRDIWTDRTVYRIMPSGSELCIYPPGRCGAGDELQDELFMDKYAFAWTGAEPCGQALESGPGQGHGIPDAHADLLVHADEGYGLAYLARSAFTAIDIHDVVYAAEESGY